MIDFRYHLVSIVAVFLALTVGIVVGTTTLNGGIVETLRVSSDKVIRDKRALEAEVKDLRTAVTRRDEFATAVGDQVIAGQLSGRRVLLVATPDAPAEVVNGLSRRVAAAGGTPGGVLRLRNDFLDPAKNQVIDDVVVNVVPPGVTLPNGTPSDRAAVELAAALLQLPGSPALSSDAAARVLGGFMGADLVAFEPPAGADPAVAAPPASLAILVTGGSDGKPLDDAGRLRQRAVLTLARALDLRSAGVVVAGPATAAEPAGLLAAVRDDRSLSDRVSSVDTADTAYGELVVVLALREQAAGRSGRYGQGPGSQAAVPGSTSP
ncbi:MAG: hypothetical protein JWN35_2546 [Frankiales bacterium]|jgi:hypothetical protein|nr:hypothetical protein [Frankiales bacterium]